jgi:hypothetical protein
VAHAAAEAAAAVEVRHQPPKPAASAESVVDTSAPRPERGDCSQRQHGATDLLEHFSLLGVMLTLLSAIGRSATTIRFTFVRFCV